jgi:hypothetical protein
MTKVSLKYYKFCPGDRAVFVKIFRDLEDDFLNIYQKSYYAFGSSFY